MLPTQDCALRSLRLITTPLLLALAAAAAESATAPLPEAPIRDDSASESVAAWNHRHVPDLTADPEAKVGRTSLAGTFGFTHHIILSAGPGRSWNLTGYGKLRFWVKADRATDNLLVMLLTRGFENRRDAVVSVGTDWRLVELPLDEATFAKNVQGDSRFTVVRDLVFYNNASGASVKLWLDGLGLADPREPQPVPLAALLPLDGATAIDLQPTDPRSRLAEARSSRLEKVPRYDLPPVAFNRENAFAEPLVDFSQASGWKAYLRDAEGYLCLSPDQSLRGVPNLKVELTATGKLPRVLLIPPQPIPATRAFNVVECWLYGGHRGTGLTLVFLRPDGSPLAAGADYGSGVDDVNPRPVGEFWNLNRTVLPERIEAGACLAAIELRPVPPRTAEEPPCQLYLDALRVFDLDESLRRPRPEFPHVGAVVDGFPTSPEGACPQTTEPVTTRLTEEGNACLLTYRTGDGEEVTYRYTPRTGTLSDLEVDCRDGSFRPADGSGPVFRFGDQALDASAPGDGRAELLSRRVRGETVRVVWRYSLGEKAESTAYDLSLRGKTLCVTATSAERDLSEWKFGVARGVSQARVIEVPFMAYTPNVLLTHGLFVSYYADWYFSNVSALPCGAEAAVTGDEAAYNWRRDQSYAYHPLTDGRRQPFQERFYLTASRRVEDVLLTVRNPPSPCRDVLKTRLYRMCLAGVPGIFGRTRAFADLAASYGVTDYHFLLHAPLFFKRYAGCEAFPGDLHVSMLHEPEGGDEGLRDLFAHLAELGVSPGYYDGFPSRDVTGPNFHYDWTSLGPDGQWSTLWRSPALKPWAFPELAATLCRERAAGYGTRVSYQDGITSWIISTMNDFDHRWPENGILRETMKALATGWQRCRENVRGPVFSEGRGSDFYHAGLNDGDYTKLKGYWDEKPCTEDRIELFVDFRLRKLGMLSAPVSLNIGYAGFAGTNRIHYETFYAQEESWQHLHHFLAAQIAFATIGMLEPYWPLWPDPHTKFDKTLASFFLLRSLQERYIMEPVADIAYADGERLVSTSDALRANVVRGNQVRIRYANGLSLWVNLNWDGRDWTVRERDRTWVLPPGGWLALQGDDFLEYSALQDGHRVDFVDGPDYVYLDGHGKEVQVGPWQTRDQFIRWKRGPQAGRDLRYPGP
jgi:hypothetical protein